MNQALAFGRHVVESTAFALLALALAALLRRSSAARHTLVLAAVMKFALPLSAFFALGSTLRALLPHAAVAVLPAESLGLLPAAFPAAVSRAPSQTASIVLLSAIAVWLAGFLPLLTTWLRRLLRPAASQPNRNGADLLTLDRMARRLGVHRSVALRASTTATTPHLRGIIRPTIVLPADLSGELALPEFEAVLLHELAHARRWDNLTRVLAHALTCVFWFHPLLWWLERRLDAEAELSCDELVLASGIPSETYLHGICKVCAITLLRPIAGRSHVSGSNLNRRLERIMSFTNARPRHAAYTTLAGALVLTATLTLATAAGLFTSTPVHAQTPDPAATSSMSCVWASKPFPQGTAIRPTHHPELLQVCGKQDASPRWFKATEAEVRTRNTLVVAVDDTPDPQTLSCKVTAPEGNFCTCNHLRNSPGSVVGSPQGRLVCPASSGKWQKFQGTQAPYPPLPADPVPIAQ